jgi:hypothetical protein
MRRNKLIFREEIILFSYTSEARFLFIVRTNYSIFLSAQIIKSLQTKFYLSNGLIKKNSKIEFIFSEGTFSTLKTNGAIKYEVFL